MIIINSKPGIIALPYREKQSDPKIIKVFNFMPGKNDIDPETWDKIKKEAGDTLHHHTHLKVFSSEDKIDIPALNAADMIELVENTIELPELEAYKKAEESRDKPRITVLKSIDEQIKSIENFNKTLEEEKKKSNS